MCGMWHPSRSCLHGIVPVLDAPASYKKHILVVRHIARCENMGMAGLQKFVYQNAVTKSERPANCITWLSDTIKQSE